ncbi:ATP-binding cassette domain-containing protein [Clostridioides sp. ZZV15-6388]|uniref:ATP-binding cassette domain-containing protein n=1 Tax=unclassified Clostridioides TaxID=2635829 RepID=UPI001D1279A2|nr:ATP-binding cassette domain-containing protein [Clostridioides sp. ZZV15-6388]MCC0662809.1 ATP-binding cassette domain-containing protein [Clostridioides sp. ZZV15-6597]
MKYDNYENLLNMSIEEIKESYSMAFDFFLNYNLSNIDDSITFNNLIESLDEEFYITFGIEKEELYIKLVEFLKEFDQDEESLNIESITINGGYNKLKEKEAISLKIKAGEIISIVGPTGSGKSRLLEDIECLAQRDTPTNRQILINESVPSDETRFVMDGKLVAQLSQNMNFVMDLTVEEFLQMHSKSRFCKNQDDIVKKCFYCANKLAGEKFELTTKITQLSGGQSRALMISDTAYMSSSPIVLIDEIENAGIDRKEALRLLSKKEKIILISTHDPILALNADKRIVIKNGGISKVISTTDEEIESIKYIESLDNILLDIRHKVRKGEVLNRKEIKSIVQEEVTGFVGNL